MNKHHAVAICAVLGLGLFSRQARATDFNDVTTDLSNVNTAPTPLPLTPGSNTLTGRTGTAGGTTDLDYFRITIPAGSHLTSITLNSTDTPSATFLGLESGTVFTAAASTTPANLLGYVHFRNNATYVGQNLEPLMATGSGAIGFSAPLGPGDYSFWLQENSTPTVNYQLSFVLTADPAPAKTPALPLAFGALVALGLGAAGARRSRRA